LNTNLEIVVQGTIRHEFNNNHQGRGCYKKKRKSEKKMMEKLSRGMYKRERAPVENNGLQLNLHLVTTPSRKMTFGSQNCPIIEASAMKS